MAYRFEHLDIWKDSIDFSEQIYRIVKKFPREELFALSDQLRRASVSISANIAEGSGSDSNKDFRNFINIAIKSLYETISLLTIANRVGYISEDILKEISSKSEILVKRIQSFRNSLK